MAKKHLADGHEVHAQPRCSDADISPAGS